jgi:two-component system, cell cycle sensor histidine kinase and response regulator CckA
VQSPDTTARLSVTSRYPRHLTVIVLTSAVATGAFGLVWLSDTARFMALATAATLVISLGLLHLRERVSFWRQQRRVTRLLGLLQDDPAPCFGTNADGVVIFGNAAADKRFSHQGDKRLTDLLADVFAHPAAVLFRLQSRASTNGFSREDVVTRRGIIRLAVHRAAIGVFLWRLEEFQDRGIGQGGDGISLPMLVVGKSGAILFVNDALRKLLGGRPRSLDKIFDSLPPRSGETVIVKAAEGPLRAYLAEVQGVAERREIYLLPLPQDADTIAPSPVEDLPVAMMRVAPSGVILSANAHARQMLDLRPDDYVNLGDLVEGLGRSLRDWLGDVLAGRLPGRAEVMRLRRPGEETFVQISVRPMGDHGQQELVAVMTDATAHKTLEAQFVQSQKMQAIGQLAGGVAHDFNNLLTAIAGHCDLLLLRHDPEGEDYNDLQQIHQNVNRASALVGQLLAFSRKQTLQPDYLDVHELLGDITHLLNRLVGEKIRLNLAPGEGLGWIRADKRQLEQVLVNLVVNARDVMPNGGEIHISAQAETLTQDQQRGRVRLPAGTYVVVRVTDEGPGIPEDLRQKVFEPFYTTKRPGEGTGLGLSTAYGIMKQSGGYIFIEDAQTGGAEFSLWFQVHERPEVATALPRTSTRQPAATVRSAQGTVLLVEDEAPVRAFAARALRLRGYTVIEADCAEAALELLADPSLRVDLFVSDVVMPGLDGPGWVREALRDRPEVRVVFVSGYAEEGFSDVRSEIPNSVFLPKPFSLDDLTGMVQRQLQ